MGGHRAAEERRRSIASHRPLDPRGRHEACVGADVRRGRVHARRPGADGGVDRPRRLTGGRNQLNRHQLAPQPELVTPRLPIRPFDPDPPCEEVFMIDKTRRGFLMLAPALVPAMVEGRVRFAQTPRTPSPEPRVPSSATAASEQSSAAPLEFPRQDPAVAREMVIVSHGNVARVKELVGARPALARAAWDWGYGDWETALGAASHVGNKEIAGVLLAAGAHPTIFSAAMVGQLDAVKAFIAASPGIQRTRGPHGITLLDHARNGKSVEVVKYLESLGDADPQYPNEALADGDALIGAY